MPKKPTNMVLFKNGMMNSCIYILGILILYCLFWHAQIVPSLIIGNHLKLALLYFPLYHNLTQYIIISMNISISSAKNKESFSSISRNNFTIILYSRSCPSQGSRHLMTKWEGFIKVELFCLSVEFSKGQFCFQSSPVG